MLKNLGCFTLPGEGYRGAYDSVQRFVRRRNVAKSGPALSHAFVPLAFAPGEVCQFDWSHEHVALGGVMQTAHNLILVGGTGTSKTHLATTLGVAAIHHGKRVRFSNAVDLVNQLEREKQQGRAGNLARQLVQTDAVIIDELGYLPFPASASFTKRPRRTSPPTSPSRNGSVYSATRK